jgi:hypothetical protein
MKERSVETFEEQRQRWFDQVYERALVLCKRMGIPPSCILHDGKMRNGTDCQNDTANTDYLLVTCTTPCRNGGHRLKWYTGHCAVCDVERSGGKQIFWTLRARRKDMTAYVAVSKSANLAKVGVTEYVNTRIDILNSEGYGGVFDWREVDRAKSPTAGKIELAVHAAAKKAGLEEHGRTYRNGVRCQELFREPAVICRLFREEVSKAA